MACAAGVAALPLVRGSEEVRTVGARVAILALLVLVAGIVLGWPRLVPVSLVLLGGLYAGQLRADGVALDGSASVVAAGLLVTAELGYWTLEEREGVEAEPGLATRRLVVVALLGIGSLLVAEALLVVADLIRVSGLALDIAGAAAAAAALGAIVVLTRSRAGG